MAFEIVQIRADEEGIRFYLERYKPFRLLALRTAPEAFGSTYERELGFTDEVWRDRVQNLCATTFVAMQSGNIVCTLTTVEMPLGLLESAPSKDPRSLHKDELKNSNELHLRINGMFTHPAARGQGIAKSLLERALRFGQEEAEKSKKSFVSSIVVDADNAPARSLYEKCGFRFVLEENYAPGRDCALLAYTADSRGDDTAGQA